MSVRKLWLIFGMTFLLLVAVLIVSDGNRAPGQGPPPGFKITILYDNTAAVENAKSDWGFACLIEGAEQPVLFDTGTKGDILLGNASLLGVDLGSVKHIVLSHPHGDHTGGLASVLERVKSATVWIPASFPEDFIRKVEAAGAKTVLVKDPVSVFENVLLTGEVPGVVNEVGLILKTSKGPTLITGCAHPGIVKMTRAAGDFTKENIRFVLGGFHLGQTPEDQVRSIIADLKALGVEKAGATHCTGDAAIALFQAAFKENFVPMGVGRVIVLSR